MNILRMGFSLVKDFTIFFYRNVLIQESRGLVIPYNVSSM
jgi:hypothetical protein